MNAPDDGVASDPVAVVLSELQTRLDALPPDLRAHAAFLSTYRRTTQAVQDAVRSEVFEDPTWVSAWDEAFARLYLAALDARISGQGRVPRPWRLAFQAPATLPPLRHVLLGINAHINFDLPQALLAVISDSDFADPELVDRRRRDHGRIDGVLSGRVAAEDAQLSRSSTRSLLDRLLQPVNRYASRWILKEARLKVWHNTLLLRDARARGPAVFASQLAELEVLSAARIAELTAPGQVLLRLAISGFGVLLPPPD
ncbi:DUF5995 family protein [Lapillicoccus sp.]|uniref:DUF5995 family protein n=1 Tax=Lapillicoccus sp. TaxID=1909287 RepID=UPI0039835DCF